MKITEMKDAAVNPNPHHVDARRLYDKENAQVVHIMLKPGESLKRHITPVDVFFYVLEGKGIVEIGDEREEAGPDTLIESPARIPHCLHNEGEGIFRVLVVKVPRPQESTKIFHQVSGLPLKSHRSCLKVHSNPIPFAKIRLHRLHAPAIPYPGHLS